LHIAWVDTSTGLQSGRDDDIFYREKKYGNQAPLTPDKPSGSTIGQAETEYIFTSCATDPEGDQLYYIFYWDDGFTSDWLGPYNSGEKCEASHIWEENGKYTIFVQVRDYHGEESPISKSTIVTMSKNKLVSKSLFDRILYRFPLLNLFLNL
jgi:hypothetical protein